MTKRLEGKVAIVTGAGSGMGEAIANLFADEGASVLAVGRESQKIHDVFGHHKTVAPLGKDLAEQDSGEVIIGGAINRFGRLDILVNNAGAGDRGRIETMEESDWRGNFEVNVHAVFRLSKAAIPYLKESTAGRIINIGSLMSEVGGPGMGGYSASKHGLAGITKQLAGELGPLGITANYIIPGAIITGMTQGTVNNDPETVAYWENRAALGRWGTPEDIAPVALFLASNDAGFVTGAGVVADGGILATA